MGGDDRRVVGGGDAEIVGIAEAADVVADHRADARTRRRAPRRATCRTEIGDVEPLVQRLDGRDDAVELLGFVDLGTGARLHPPDVEDVGALRDQRLGPPEQGVELEGGAVVVEGVGGAVEDAHHQRAGGEVVDLVTEAVPERGHARGAYAHGTPPPRGHRAR